MRKVTLLDLIEFRKLNEYRNPSTLPPINPDIWYQFQLVFPGAFALKPSSKMELCLVLEKLRAVLFNNQPLLSKPFCVALIPPLYCVCSGLYVCESYFPPVWVLLIMST